MEVVRGNDSGLQSELCTKRQAQRCRSRELQKLGVLYIGTVARLSVFLALLCSTLRLSYAVPLTQQHYAYGQHPPESNRYDDKT